MSNTDKFIDENRINTVEIILNKIDEMIKKNSDNELYEDCSRLKNMKKTLKKFLNGKITFDKIKDDYYFANNKLNDLVNNAIKKN